MLWLGMKFMGGMKLKYIINKVNKIEQNLVKTTINYCDFVLATVGYCNIFYRV
jgi:hypothetical protein